jgi:hypothetical protein
MTSNSPAAGVRLPHLIHDDVRLVFVDKSWNLLVARKALNLHCELLRGGRTAVT